MCAQLTLIFSTLQRRHVPGSVKAERNTNDPLLRLHEVQSQLHRSNTTNGEQTRSGLAFPFLLLFKPETRPLDCTVSSLVL